VDTVSEMFFFLLLSLRNRISRLFVLGFLFIVSGTITNDKGRVPSPMIQAERWGAV